MGFCKRFTIAALARAVIRRFVLLVPILGALVFKCDAFEQSGFCGVKMTCGVTNYFHPLAMVMKIKLRMVGRKNGGEKWLEDAYAMYKTRLRTSNIEVETAWHKNDNEILKGIDQDVSKGHKGEDKGVKSKIYQLEGSDSCCTHTVVLLDPRGKLKSSEQFSEDVYEWLNEGGSRLVFVIGGADGLPPELKSQATRSIVLLSLSTLTFTHQFARTVLVEQIYRASEIKKGSGYHK